MVKDMGKSLDWFLTLTVEKHWKTTRVVFGPGKSIMVGLHPDVLKVLLKAGIGARVFCMLTLYLNQ